MRDSWDGNCSVEWDRLKQKGSSGAAPFSCSFRADAECRWVTEGLISCSWQMLAGAVVSRALKSSPWRLHGMRYGVGGSTLLALDSCRTHCSSLSRCLALDTSPARLWPVRNCSVSWDIVSVGSLCCGLVQGNVCCCSLTKAWDGFVLSFCGHLGSWAFILSWFYSLELGTVISGRPLIFPAKGCIPASAVFHPFVHFLCIPITKIIFACCTTFHGFQKCRLLCLLKKRKAVAWYFVWNASQYDVATVSIALRFLRC